MEIRQLRYFISVAEHLNFTQAAKKLFVAQPAISQQIASLEKKMGLKLFERDKHSVRLTHAGKVFLDDAIELLEKTEESINRAKKAAVGEIGHLSIGFLYAPVKNFLPSFIKDFREKYPSIQIGMNHYQTAEVIEKLTNDDIDIAFIMSFKPEDRAELEYHSLFSQPYCVFIDQNHPLAKKRSISIKALTNEPIVMLDRKESPHGYDHLITLFASHGSLPNISMHTERIETVLMLVESGLGVAILPKHLHVYANPSIRCIEIMDWKHTVDIGVAWKKDNENPSIALFIEELEMINFPQYNKSV